MAIYNIPAPAGSTLVQQQNAQAFQQLGRMLGLALYKRQQGRLESQDLAAMQSFQQEQQQIQGGGFVGPPQQQPVFQSQRGRDFQFQQQFRDPLQRQLMESQIAENWAQAQPQPLSPSQQVSQEKLDRIRSLRTKEDSGTITKPESAELQRLRGGGALVDISLGAASPTERTAIAETRASVDALDNLKALFDSPRTETGPVKGRVAPFAGLAGLTTDEQESFMAATSAFKNQIIKEITGAQMSEQEAKRIMKQIPDIIDPPARWKAKWEQSKKNLEHLQKRRMEILEQSGLRAPGMQTPIGESQPGLTPAEQNELAELLRQQ